MKDEKNYELGIVSYETEARGTREWLDFRVRFQKGWVESQANAGKGSDEVGGQKGKRRWRAGEGNNGSQKLMGMLGRA